MRHDAVVEVSVETLQNVARLKTSPETIYTLVGQATFLVLSSRCYENFLRVIIEAFFAKGTRLIASKLGRRWPRLSTMGTSGSISSGISRRSRRKNAKHPRDQGKLRPMRQAARREFDHQFTADVNHHRLAAF